MTHIIRKLAAAFILALLAPLAFAQGAVSPAMFTPFKKGGATTLTAATTATSGCTDGAFLYSLTSLLRCGAGAITDGTTVTLDNQAAAASILVLKDNGSAVVTFGDGGAIMHAGTQADFVSGSCGINSTGNFVCYNGSRIGFTSAGSSVGGSPDVYFMREAAATFQMGVDINGAAVNQTLKAHDGITGTDIKGASLTLSPGLGTGAAVSNPLTLNRVVTKATGTTAQTYSPAIIACPTKILSNTSATAQTIATITTTSTTGGSVTMDYTTVANNGTLQDTDSGMVKVSWNNNAGTVAAAMTAVALQSDQDASGTLATTPTATVATNVISIKFTPTWVTIVPTTVTGWALFHLATSGDTVVCQ